MRVLLLGGTDLTKAIAEMMVKVGLDRAGVVYVPRAFPISYEPNGVQSSRFADLGAWCAAANVPSLLYERPDGIGTFAEACRADFALAAGWYHLVPRVVRSRFAAGCAGVHASLLPKFRGGAPLNWALLAGETQAGVSLFELGDGIDDGPLYGQRSFPIGPRTRIADLVAAAESAALALVEECLPGVAAGRLVPRPQEGAPSYGLQRAPGDGEIDWTQSAVDIDRLVRAVGRPYPGAFSYLHDTQVIVWEAEPFSGMPIYGRPGQLALLPGEPDPSVVTGSGVLIVTQASRSNGESVMPRLRRSANQRFESRHGREGDPDR